MHQVTPPIWADQRGPHQASIVQWGTMAKPVPNWKLIDCPKCGRPRGRDCFVAHIDQFCCPERQAAVGIGRKVLPLPLNVMNPGKNPTYRCKMSAHKNCSGHHHGNHGLPGLKCTCSCHCKRRETL
jgi:hypothetical protein